jgi:hypothetical protein
VKDGTAHTYPPCLQSSILYDLSRAVTPLKATNMEDEGRGSKAPFYTFR